MTSAYDALPPIAEDSWRAFQHDLLAEASKGDLDRLASAGWDFQAQRDLDAMKPPPPPPRPWWEQATADLAGLAGLGQTVGQRAGEAVQGVGQAVGQAAGQAGDFLGDVGQGLQEGWQVATAPPAPLPPTGPLAPVAPSPGFAQAAQELDAQGFPIRAPETTAQLGGLGGTPPVAPEVAQALPTAFAPEPYPETVWSPSEQRPFIAEALQGGTERAIADVGEGLGRLGENLPAANEAIGRARAGDLGAVPDAAGALGQSAFGAVQVAGAPLNIPSYASEELARQTGAPAPVVAGVGLMAGLATPGPDELARLGQVGKLLGPRGDVIREATRPIEDAASTLLGPRGEPIRQVVDEVAERVAQTASSTPNPLRTVLDAVEQSSVPPGVQAAKATLTDKAIAFSLSNMFGPATLAVNLVSGLTETAARPLTELIEGRPIEAAKDVLAMAEGFGKAFSAGTEAFVRGGRAARVGSAVADVATRPEAFPGWTGAVATPALRAMAAGDQFIRTLNLAGATAVGASRGLTGTDVVDFATKAADRAVFQGPSSPMGKAVLKARNLVHSQNPGERLAGIAAHVLFPFVAIPEQIFGRGAMMLGGHGIAAGRALARGDIDVARTQAARQAIMLPIGAAITWQTLQGNVTGNGPKSAQERAVLMEATDAEGNPLWRPHSVRVGGRWLDYNTLGPVSIPMAAISNAVEAFQEQGVALETARRARKPLPEGWQQLQAGLTEAANRMWRTGLDATYLQTIGDVFKAGGEGRLVQGLTQGLPANILGRVVPYQGFLRSAARASTPEVREPRNVLEQVAQNIPGLEGAVPTRVSATTGQAVEEPQDLLSLLTRSPAGQGARTPNPVAAEVSRLEQQGSPIRVRQFGRPGQTEYAGMPQSDEQRRTLQETYGKATNRYVRNAVVTPAYRAADDAGKAALLNSALTAAGQQADVELGHRVARDPASRATIDKLSYPRFAGVDGSVEEIRRGNFETREAKNKLAEYRRAYGEAASRRLYEDDRPAWRLAQRGEINPDWLRVQDARVDRAVGNLRSSTPGLSNTTVPTAPPLVGTGR